jgi:RimJ/RimL family protein N-acetyltransferase
MYIGADIHPDYQGKGYGKQVYEILIPHLFEVYSLNKLSLEVLATNQRALNLYLKVGFKYEGTKREEVYRETGYIDSIMMSILKSDL